VRNEIRDPFVAESLYEQSTCLSRTPLGIPVLVPRWGWSIGPKGGGGLLVPMEHGQ